LPGFEKDVMINMRKKKPVFKYMGNTAFIFWKDRRF
jgi:hypothetical protein